MSKSIRNPTDILAPFFSLWFIFTDLENESPPISQYFLCINCSIFLPFQCLSPRSRDIPLRWKSHSDVDGMIWFFIITHGSTTDSVLQQSNEFFSLSAVTIQYEWEWHSVLYSTFRLLYKTCVECIEFLTFFTCLWCLLNSSGILKFNCNDRTGPWSVTEFFKSPFIALYWWLVPRYLELMQYITILLINASYFIYYNISCFLIYHLIS